VRIARAVEYGQPVPVKYGQHVPITFASRFTSLPRGWRMIGVVFDREDNVYLAWSYTIARLHTISPATPSDSYRPDMPDIQVSPAFPANNCALRPGSTHRQVTIHGHRFTLSGVRVKKHGVVVWSYKELCGNHVNGLLASVEAFGAHPGFPPVKVMERLQLLGARPADWVTNPMP
jgi:hypothetical protein